MCTALHNIVGVVQKDENCKSAVHFLYLGNITVLIYCHLTKQNISCLYLISITLNASVVLLLKRKLKNKSVT